MSENEVDRERTGARGPSGAEPSAADASRALAQRLARADVVGHGTVPFRSPAEREPTRRGRSRLLAVGIVLVVVAVLAVAAAIVVTVLS